MTTNRKVATGVGGVVKADDRPAPQFQLGTTICVPDEINADGIAKIIGREFGCSYSQKHHHGWVYYIAFFGVGGPAWEATEGELIQWQKE